MSTKQEIIEQFESYANQFLLSAKQGGWGETKKAKLRIQAKVWKQAAELLRDSNSDPESPIFPIQT